MIKHWAFYHPATGELHTMVMGTTDHQGCERDAAASCPKGYKVIELQFPSQHATHRVDVSRHDRFVADKGAGISAGLVPKGPPLRRVGEADRA